MRIGMATTRAALTRGRGPLGFTPPSRRHVAGRAGKRGGGPVRSTGFGHGLGPFLCGPEVWGAFTCVAPRDGGGGRGGSRFPSQDCAAQGKFHVSVGEAALEA